MFKTSVLIHILYIAFTKLPVLQSHEQKCTFKGQIKTKFWFNLPQLPKTKDNLAYQTMLRVEQR